MWNYTKLAKYIPGLRQIYFDFKQSSDAIFSFLERQIEEHNKADGLPQARHKAIVRKYDGPTNYRTNSSYDRKIN
uniref:Uncharacterized protein n=1 Tax=Acrobeloides nanus TaxID=290746 RepID=A0A914CQH0_9BILA